MALPRSFQNLCSLPPNQRTAMGIKLLQRTMREEWPLIAHLRRRLTAAGLDGRRHLGLDEFHALPPESLARFLSQSPRDLCPQPDPGRIRQNWGWPRKLGLVLARGKGGQLLQRGYQANLADPLPDSLSGGREKRVQSSEHDEELLAEQGCRCLLLLGIKAGPLVLDPRVKIEALTRRALVGAARLLELPLGESPPKPGEDQGVLFTTKEALKDGALGSGEVVLLDPTGPEDRGILTLTAARLVLPVLGDTRGAILWDDLMLAEAHEDGIAMTHLAHHGTMLAKTVVNLPDAFGRLELGAKAAPFFPRLTQG